jgi:hypothetical protein
MRKLVLAALTVASLGAGSAFAQGVPPGYVAPVYGSQAFSGQRNAPPPHFLGQDTVLGKLFRHTGSAKVNRG